MDRKAFGRNINLARKNLGITSEKLSELCNVNPVFIRQIESGRKLPSLPVFISICNALLISPNFLLQNDLVFNELDHLKNISDRMKKLSSKQLEQMEIMMDTFFKDVIE